MITRDSASDLIAARVPVVLARDILIVELSWCAAMLW